MRKFPFDAYNEGLLRDAQHAVAAAPAPGAERLAGSDGKLSWLKT